VPGLLAQTLRPLIAYDAPGHRLLVVSIEVTNNMAKYTLYEANLATSQWSMLRELSRSVIGDRLFAVDSSNRVGFESPSLLGGMVSLAPGSELERLPFALDGALPPSSISGAALLPDGRVITSGPELSVFDPSSGRYTPLGKLALPPSNIYAHSLTFDPVDGHRVLVFGGSGNGTMASNALYAIATDGSVLTPVATTGSMPPPRAWHAAAVVGGELVIAGGVGASTAPLGDVYALDLSTRVWRKVGDLSQPRAWAAWVVRGTELWMIGGGSAPSASSGTATIEAIDVSSGVRRDIASTGAWPPRNGLFWEWAPLGAAIVAIDSGDSVDYGSNQLWELTLTDTTASWSNSDPKAMDAALTGLVGVGGCSEAWFLGPNTWRLRRH
jgi:hypothetical protein